MRFSEKWLCEWINGPLSHRELVEQLTMIGLEVDQVEPAGGHFSAVVVGRIEAVDAHPQADKLKVCLVNDGSDQALQIVCGAANARPGLLAPLARVGAQLPGGREIAATELRGVASQGMLCSAQELGLFDDAAGLYELPAEATPGQDLAELLDLDDYCIEIDLTPNRGDCLSVLGVAQDLAAYNGYDVLEPPTETVKATIDDELAVTVQQADACPRYVGRIIRGIDRRAQTPLWMQERLRRAGIRSIDPVVDVTQYVMLELGQPMHAYDLDHLSGPVGVRWGRHDEQLQLLDQSVIELHDQLLCITDDDRVVGLAGVMGGLDTSVTAATSNLFLEAAYFSSRAIIGRARSLGLHTDAAHRFERGVDPQLQARAMERACALLLSIVGGQAGPLIEQQSQEHIPQPASILLRRERIHRLLGLPLDDAEIERILQGLGMVVRGNGRGWSVRAPSRRPDLQQEVDLIEEVARIHGYQNIPEAPLSGALSSPVLPEQRIELARLRQTLVERGYFEAINYSFVAAEQLAPIGDAERALPLANPLSADLSVMRTSLLPGLLAALSHNQHRQANRVRLFESGVCFVPATDQPCVREVRHLAAVVWGAAAPEQWGRAMAQVDFFDLKGDVEALLALTGQSEAFSFQAEQQAWLHPGQTASIDRNGQAIGWLAALHPKWLQQADVRGPVFAFELNLDELLPCRVPNVREISRYPSIRRDIALLVADQVAWQEIRQTIEEIAGNLLTELVVFDEYKGAGIEQGKKSLAVGLVLQDKTRTLTDNEVDAVIESVVTHLSEQLDAELRG